MPTIGIIAKLLHHGIPFGTHRCDIDAIHRLIIRGVKTRTDQAFRTGLVKRFFRGFDVVDQGAHGVDSEAISKSKKTWRLLGP